MARWQLPGRITQGRGLCASLVLPLALGTLPDPRACPAPGTAGEEEAEMQCCNYSPFLLRELVQRKIGLCLLLLLLIKYLGCCLSLTLGFCILLSHYPIMTLQPLAHSDTQVCASRDKFPALLYLIFPFPVQPLGQKSLLSSVTSFAPLDIWFIFICFLRFYAFSCLLVGSITGQEAARYFYHSHVSNWDLLGSVGHCIYPRTDWEFNRSAVSQFTSVFEGAQSCETPDHLQCHFRVCNTSLLGQFLCSSACSTFLDGFRNYSLKTLEQAGFIICLSS